MRTALALFSGCFPKQDYKKIQKDVRKVTRALGEARDLDVQLEVIEAALAEFADPVLQPGIKRLKLRLTQRRAEVQQHVDAAMDRMLAEQLIERLENWVLSLLKKQDLFVPPGSITSVRMKPTCSCSIWTNIKK